MFMNAINPATLNLLETLLTFKQRSKPVAYNGLGWVSNTTSPLGT